MPQYSNLSGENSQDDSSHPHLYLAQSPTHSKQPHIPTQDAPSRLVQFLPALAALLTMGFIPAAGEPVGGLPWWAWLLIVIGVLLLLVLLWWLFSGRERPSAEAPTHTTHETAHETPTEAAPAAPVEVAAPAPAPVEVVAETPVAAAAEPEAAAEAPIPPDDLEIIEGIGPKIASVFKAAGIVTFQQLAQADPAHLETVLREAGLRLADPTTWPEQARLAAAGQWDELKALQDRLKGGR